MTNNYQKIVIILLTTVSVASLTFPVKGTEKSEIKIYDTGMKINSSVNSFLKSLPARVEEAFEESGLPSLSIAIVYDRDFIYNQAFGYADLEKKIPATTKTIYPIGSITKVFVATMLVQLAEAGIVTLDTPVKKYLSEYKVKSPYKGTQLTTLRQLAMHTSGFYRGMRI